MARRPYFSGNYGSALGSTANAANLLARAGETQGKMFANMGAQVGGMIQQYGLNKEKRAKEESAAMGAIAGFSPQELQEVSTEYPELGKSVEKVISGKHAHKDIQNILASVGPLQARKTRELDKRFKEVQIKGQEFKNLFNEADKENKLLRSTLENEGKILFNNYQQTKNDITEIEKSLKSNEREFDRDKKYAELEQKQLELEKMRQDIQSKKNTNSVFAEQLDRERTKFAVGVSEATSRLALNARKIDELDANSDIDFKTKEEKLALLKAERQGLESDLLRKQQLANEFNLDSSENEKQIDLIDDINIADAAQGDGAGLLFRAAESIGGALGQNLTPETTAQAQNIQALNMYLRPALTKTISSRPSNYTQEIVNQNLLNRNDGNAVFTEKIKKLIPMLNDRLQEAVSTVKAGNQNADYYREAYSQAQRLPKLISKLKKSLNSDTEKISEEELLNRY